VSAEPRYPYVHVDVPAAEAEEVAAELWGLGAQGIEQRDATTLEGPDHGGAVTLVAYVPEETHARAMARSLSSRFAARVDYVVGDAWRDAWREHFRPARVGARLVVRPSWEVVEPWPGEVVITVDPEHAFGSGTHETTRLCLRELDRRLRGGEGVLDVGCGSGILSVAAALLGAERVRALDVDPDAVEVTRANARHNRVAGRITVSTTPVAGLRGRHDLVVANIQSSVLVPLAEPISRRVAPGGWLVLSGILRGEQDAVASAFEPLSRCVVTAEGEWVAVVLRKGSP